MRTRTIWARSLFLAAAITATYACGDDDEAEVDAGPVAGSAAKSGTGGKASAGSGGKAGGGAGGRAGTTGTAGAAAGVTGGMMLMCTEPVSTAAVTCGGAACTAPAEFAMNMCILPCCVNLGGKEMCGSRSTAMNLTTDCTLPAAPDPKCPNVSSQGGDLVGCCNKQQGKCGIVSTLRPGCITSSTFVMLPDPPMMCGDDQDAGAPDAG